MLDRVAPFLTGTLVGGGDTTVEWLGIFTLKFQASAGGSLPPYLPLPSQSAPKQWKQGAFHSCGKSS